MRNTALSPRPEQFARNALSHGLMALLLAACLCLAGLSAPAFALKSDADKPVEIESDSADFNQEQSIYIYRGNVRLRQGTRRLWADVLNVFVDDDGGVEKVIATGKPARFRQRQDGKPEDSFGEAKRIEYYADKEHYILFKDAKSWREGNLISSDRIDYWGETGQIISKRSKKTDRRVRVTLPPKKKKTTP